MTAVDLDALDAARAAATPGTWHVARGGGIDAGEYDTVIGRGDVDCMSHCYGGTSTIEGDNLDADAALIVAAVNALPDLIADARKLRALRDAVNALHQPADPCSCGGRRWVDDQGWSPEDYERNRPRTEGNGLIPCGFCNFGGWSTDQYEPADPVCDVCDLPAPCPTVRAVRAALGGES